MHKSVLWMDDDPVQRHFGDELLASIGGIRGCVAASSTEAKRILESEKIDVLVTDILRRSLTGTPTDDGYEFVRSFIRPRWPTFPVVFHTKNLPHSFEVDDHSQYLSKWEEPPMKRIELEQILADRVRLYESFIDDSIWNRIQPRLVEIQRRLLERLRSFDDLWLLTPDQFEELVGELLEKMSFRVLWIPGGKDGGIDIVAGAPDRDFLIDVKRYRTENPVGVEVVRRVYGVATSVGTARPGEIVRGGIVTSSRFTTDALAYSYSLRERPLLLDGKWLKEELARYCPRLSHQ